MSISVHVIASAIDDTTLELCGHALASTNPPLSQVSIDRIAEIEAIRMESLQGGDLFQAGKFFELLRGLPPSQGPKAAAFLNLLANTDFSFQSVVEVLSDPSIRAEVKHEPKINRGFETVAAVVVGREEGVEITFDVDKSEREGMDTLAHMYVALSAISEQQVRTDLVEDCKKIVELRFEFDLIK